MQTAAFFNANKRKGAKTFKEQDILHFSWEPPAKITKNDWKERQKRAKVLIERHNKIKHKLVYKPV